MLWFALSRNERKTLVMQIEEELRNRIFSGQLSADEQLPSSRELAKSLGVSRNTVNEAYEQLLLEGYIYRIARSGTYVSKGLSFQKEQGSILGEKMVTNVETKKDVIDFKASQPAIDYFPKHAWANVYKQVCLAADDHVFGYQTAYGNMDLRAAIANYLGRLRGVNADPNQIFITTGATQALSLLTRLLASEGDVVCVEDPVTEEMRRIFLEAGAVLQPIHTDEHGMDPANLPQSSKPRFVFTIPSHQFPLGAIMPVKRRIQLVEYARKMNTYIIEDDYDSEFIYEGTPVQAMQSLDGERVIYIGTFSKILSPSLRIGYMVLPYHLVKRAEQQKWFTDRHSSSLEQMALAAFINEGSFEKHIRKMKKLYARRRKVLVEAINDTFRSCDIIGQAAGMHLVVRFKDRDEINQKNLAENKVKAVVVEDFSLRKGFHKNELILGYGHLNEMEIKEGVIRLKKALQ
ncbi:GntR family transcriptional regulator/MocR family aminotransferase [Alkalihalobacillus xiaoxiensis]|uniref:GntR family transcriptional regulator/MocR family aminotransferase n=1 Tax=Shouchella xiaoxiensis TaxID=766895 RepID=A0ABS2SW48_9BACI|nr:PLP-dependent aminotransferase family protein [Shouchella xiaoxiensis]MBM7839737.1 GntR family transcriptional regulator/MocR family aminotransferase [Shouchella xiaoxiensis]